MSLRNRLERRISLSPVRRVSPRFSFMETECPEQVLINLLDNAVKYGRQGGKIRILAVERDGNEIQISVEDDGIGIPKEDLPRIFDDFIESTKEDPKSWGEQDLAFPL